MVVRKKEKSDIVGYSSYVIKIVPSRKTKHYCKFNYID